VIGEQFVAAGYHEPLAINKMIFVFVEDGTLEIVDGIEQARQNYEGIDVESGVFQFYNDKGIYLKPRFIKPNKTRRFFWIFKTIESGIFELVPDPNTDEDDIWTCISETVALEPNSRFKTIEEVKLYLKDC
jgi:hypothetical protein